MLYVIDIFRHKFLFPEKHDQVMVWMAEINCIENQMVVQIVAPLKYSPLFAIAAVGRQKREKEKSG